MTAVTVEDIEEGCDESSPCRHGPFKIELKDGRAVSLSLRAIDIHSILIGLDEIGVEHPSLDHFSSSCGGLEEIGWTYREPNEILTEIFSRNV
jgi:hypothetical protein